MALTVKVKDDGQAIPTGDTQGLLIPASARGCIGKFTGPLTIASGAANITYSYDSGENWIVDGGIKVPKTGMYIVSEALNTEGSGTERVTTYRIFKNSSLVGQSQQLTTNQAGDWSSYCNSTQIYCNEGDILKFNVNMYTGTNLVVTNSWLCVTLVEQSVPDIIANKGALVSNPTPGGVTFDTDGLLKMNIPLNKGNVNGANIDPTNGLLYTNSAYMCRFCTSSPGSTNRWYKWIGKNGTNMPDFSATLYGASQGSASMAHRGIFDLVLYRSNSDFVAVLQRRTGLGNAALSIGYDSNGDLYLYVPGNYMALVIELYGTVSLFTSYASDTGALPSTTTQPTGWTVLASV
jgi:hypothetical protein